MDIKNIDRKDMIRINLDLKLISGQTIIEDLADMLSLLNFTAFNFKIGPGLVFLVYSTALSELPFPSIWAVLFFLMLFTVGFNSQV